MRLFFLLLPLLLAATAANAAVYKWTDQNGQIQYGEHPPAGGNAEKMAPAPPPADPGAKRESLDKQLEDMQTSSEERGEREAEYAKKEEIAKIRTENCKVARNNLVVLNQGGHRLTRMPDGSYKRLEPEEKEAMIAETQKQIETNCD